MQRPRTFAEFWPHYVLAHRHPVTRASHFTGTLLAWGLVVAAILLRNGWLVVAALVVPYALAWFSHFFVEHNRRRRSVIRSGPGWQTRKWSH